MRLFGIKPNQMTGFLSIILCLLTVVMLWRYLRAKADPSGHAVPRFQFLLPWAATIIAMALFISSRLYSTQGIDFGFYNSLLIASCVICSLLYLVSIFKQVEHLGLIVLPVAIVCMVINVAFVHPASSLIPNTGMQAHIITSIIAFSILCLAAAQAVLLFVQEKNLKHHTSYGFLRAFPSLHESETLLFQSIGLGVLLLTIALATGFIFLEDIFAQHLVHKTTLSMLSWLVFVVLLWGRFQFGWRGATAIRWALGGFTFLILAYYGSKFVLELILLES